MKILITGGLGHIGSYILRNLRLKKKIHYIIVDNLITQRFVSLFDLKKYCSFEFHNIDVAKNNIENLIEKSNIVIHLAAITDAEGSFKIKRKVNLNNYESTKKIVLSSKKHNKPVIYTSSTSVYGPVKKNIDESLLSKYFLPQSPYAKSKIKEENLIRKLKDRNFKFMILRLGTIFGKSPGMRFHTAVNKFCWQAVNNLPITVWKNALNKKRPYLDLKDLVRVLRFIINRNKFDCSTINVVSNNYEVNDLLTCIKKFKKIKIIYTKSKILNQDSYIVKNNYLLKNKFKMKGNLLKAIKETIEILKNK
jgi:nucleoside-diphosphate-sugar epimerase